MERSRLAVTIFLGRAARIGAILALGYGAYWCIRLAYADYLASRGGAEDIARAIELVPFNANYRFKDAALSRESRIRSLEEAAGLNPGAPAAMLELGLLAESRGDLPTAEQWLLRAAAADKTYTPRWTLTSYYFRRGNTEEFWRWAREAAEIAPGNLMPLFGLCWKMADDPALLAQKVVPDRPKALRQFLQFLAEKKRLDAGEETVRRLLQTAGRDAAPLALAHCNRLIEGGELRQAVWLWNELIERKLTKAAPLDPEQGLVLTNGSFKEPPLRQGFDWRFPAVEGVSVRRPGIETGLSILFSGRQPEQCQPLVQYLPLLPGEYRLEYQYRTEGIGARSGLRWEIAGSRSGYLFSEEWRTDWMQFKVRGLPFTRPTPLGLVYRRPSGTVRIEGSLWLRKVSLKKFR